MEKLPVDELVKLRGCIAPRLQDPSKSVRLSALAALGKLPACELVALSDSIVPLLQDNRKEVRAEAFALFGQLVLTKDLISLVDKIAPSFAASFGCRSRGSKRRIATEGRPLRFGQEAEQRLSEIARSEGHLGLAGRVKSDFLRSSLAKERWSLSTSAELAGNSYLDPLMTDQDDTRPSF